MDIQKIKREGRKTPVTFRLPDEIRTWAKEIAQKQSSPDMRVSEGDVYRAIVTSYFSENRLQKVDNKNRESA